jgi:hypothetical protein
MTPQDQPPAPTESALRYAIALCNGRLDVEAPYHAAIIAGYVATLERLLQPPPEPPAPTLRALIEAVARKLHVDALREWPSSTDPFRLGYDSAVMDFRRVLLAALLTETDGPAPQNGTTNQTGTGETTRS